MNESPDHGWVRSHKSAIFLAGLILLAIALIVAGVVLSRPEDALLQGLGAILSQYGSVILAACTIGVFFAFRDVRDMFTSALGKLLFDAGIVNHMKDATKDKLELKIAEAALPKEIDSIDLSLHDFLKYVRATSSRLPIMRNYHESINFSPHPTQRDLVVYSDVISFQLDAQHFTDNVAIIPYRFCFAFANPEDKSIDEAKAHIEFTGRLGSRDFRPEDLKFKPYKYGTYPMLLAELETQLTIPGSLDVRMSFHTSKVFFDNSEVTYVRYPCRGFTVSMHFLPGYDYDYAWFAQWTDISSSLPKIGEHQAEQTGITVSTNDWMLPGEGVVLSWYKPVEVGGIP